MRIFFEKFRKNFLLIFSLQVVLFSYVFKLTFTMNLIMIEFTIVCFTYVFLNRSFLFQSVKIWTGSVLYTGVTIFLSKIISGLILNRKFSIETQYISNSSVILGLIISFGFLFLFASVYLFVIDGFAKLKKDYKSEKLYEKEKAPYLRAFFIFGVLMGALPFFYLSEYLSNKTLLADSAKVSDCGPLLDNVFYLRKNKFECYAIRADVKRWNYSMMDYNKNE